VPPEDLELIKIPIAWIKNPPARFQQIKKNEFRLDGNLYDIVYRASQTDTLWLYCLADEAETLLFAQLDSWAAQQNTHDPFQRGQLLQWERLLNSLYQIVPSFNQLLNFPASRSGLPPYRFSFLPWEPEAIKPPPEV
jgi:hypothetical protein